MTEFEKEKIILTRAQVWISLFILIVAVFIGIQQNSINQQLLNLASLKDRPILKILPPLKEGGISLTKDKKAVYIDVSLGNLGSVVGKLSNVESEICFYDLEDELPDDCREGEEEKVYIKNDKPSNITGVIFPNDRHSLRTLIELLDDYKQNRVLGIFKDSQKNNQGPVIIVKLKVTYYSMGDVERKKEYVTKVKIRSDGRDYLGLEFLDAS